ncbi:peroxiredoxin [Paenibacillus aurantius]|uniref:thioredoxin-dependent peroxiredoxin n=1 Tax=Paenibacillus aurantius TaxID=2918900 RepID=A0AA96LCL1_9BACL|nr:peroxiredoxin [Paenibacillus aurantius]WNQ09755.1 peroxiredoxin [Paenibacillus aurantius]
MLQVGDTAPSFQAESTQGKIDLKPYIGRQPIVLIFYPKNETPICTKQLCAVRDSKQQYARYHALVLGVNQGSLQQHEKFARHHGYDFPLLSDSDGEINKSYDVGNFLFGLIGQNRIVYVIGLDGKIAYARKGNRPTSEILEALESAVGAPQS